MVVAMTRLNRFYRMTQTQLRSFIVRVLRDHTIQDKSLTASTPGHVIDIAKANGHYLTPDALTAARLSDEEIEGVAKCPQRCLWKSAIYRQDATLL